MYVVVFGLSYGPLIWTLPSEVFQNVHRAKGVGFAVAVSWLANFVIVSSKPLPLLLFRGHSPSCIRSPKDLGRHRSTDDHFHQIRHVHILRCFLCPCCNIFVLLRARGESTAEND